MKVLKFGLMSLLVCGLAMSCGGENKKEKEKTPLKIKSTTKEEVKEDTNVATVTLTGDDAMKFDKTELKVKSGQKVKLILRHKGKMPITAMGHNVVILKKGVDVAAFANKAALARDTNYIPKDSEDIIAFTETIGGGQTTSIEFDAPEVGTYDFICSFPGHYALMKGKFIVE